MRCFRYSRATPVLLIIFVHGMNLAALEHPWSMIMRMESKPCDLGRSVMRSIDTYWKGPSSTGMSKCCRGAFDQCTLVLDSWQCVQPLVYCSMNSCSLGPLYCSRTNSQVLEIPGWPAEGELWRSFRTLHCSSRSSLRKILQICGAKRWSGRRMQGSEVSTPLLRSFLRDNKSAMVFVDLGMCSRVLSKSCRYLIHLACRPVILCRSQKYWRFLWSVHTWIGWEVPRKSRQLHLKPKITPANSLLCTS